MKPAINITATILACGMAAGLASAQSPSVIQNTRSTMNGVSGNARAASNQALAPQSGSAGANAGRVSANSGTSTRVVPVKSASRRKHEPRHVVGIVAVPGAGAVVAVPNSNPAVGVSVTANRPSESGDAEHASNGQPAPENRSYANGRRDPFVSPVVSHAGGSGCSTGKKCLEIGAINLQGVVHSDGGFIAVVSNSLNKAYFLRENDPVFNGYVVKITGDSIVFQETVQDRLGKTFTREVVKKITTPAV
jgi:hypothetical protein